MQLRRSLILSSLLALPFGAPAQAVHRGQLVTSLGGGAGTVTLSGAADSLNTSNATCGSATFAFAYALSDSWSLGLRWDRIGSDLSDSSVELLRCTTYLLDGTYRPWSWTKGSVEFHAALGASILALKPWNARLPIRGQNSAGAIGIRYLHFFSATIAGFVALEHAGSRGVPLRDYDGNALLDPDGGEVLSNWNSQRLNVGLIARF